MTWIAARLPNGLVDALDEAANRLEWSRSELVREAVERYIEDLDDISAAAERLRDPNDPELDWNRVRVAHRRDAHGPVA